MRTAEELGILEMDYEAARRLLPLLESGYYSHDQQAMVRSIEHGDVLDGDVTGFDMRMWWGRTECGTVGCIAGLMQLLGAADLHSRIIPQSLSELFFPGIDPDRWGEITPAMAARALRSYLETGEPQWADVLADAGLLS